MATTHVEINNTYLGTMITMEPIYFKQCAYSCQMIMNYNTRFGMSWRILPSWVGKIYQRLQLPPMTYCAVTINRHHNAKHTNHPGQWCSSRVRIQTTARQSQETMEYHLRMSRANYASKWFIMQENACHKKLILTQGPNHGMLESTWHIYGQLRSTWYVVATPCHTIILQR